MTLNAWSATAICRSMLGKTSRSMTWYQDADRCHSNSLQWWSGEEVQRDESQGDPKGKEQWWFMWSVEEVEHSDFFADHILPVPIQSSAKHTYTAGSSSFIKHPDRTRQHIKAPFYLVDYYYYLATRYPPSNSVHSIHHVSIFKCSQAFISSQVLYLVHIF